MLHVSKNNRKNVWKIISVLLVIVWMVMIFVMSNFPAETSSKQSGVVVEVVKTVFKVSPKQPDLFNNLTTIVRKCGHAFEYFVLGVLLLNMLRQFWPAKHKGEWARYWYLAVVGASIYAVTDEVHQAFVPGRSCELRDIIIDTVAAGVGVGLAMLIRRWRKTFRL
jgi:VanZ family protein